jgi:hypothetical protein
MIDFNQLILAVVVLLFTGVGTTVGVQLVRILGELRQSIQKMNKVLDDTGIITESVSKPVNMLSGMVMGLKALKKLNV